MDRNIVGNSITVVIATYNGGKFLQEQIESILQQTVVPDEIIVCDDLSTDNTIEILEHYQSQKRLRYYINENRLGVIGNFKRSVSLAKKGNYIALCDQDDIWLPVKLEKQYQALLLLDDKKSPAIVYSDLTVIDQQKKILNPSFWNELGQDGYQHSLTTLLFGNFVTGCTIMMNDIARKYFLQMPTDISMHDAWLALIAFSFGKVEAVKEPLVLYRRHTSNTAFAAAYKKENKAARWWRNLKMLFSENDYLKDEIHIASKLFEKYEMNISNEKKYLIENFINLKGKYFFQKKWTFRKYFKGYWRN